SGRDRIDQVWHTDSPQSIDDRVAAIRSQWRTISSLSGSRTDSGLSPRPHAFTPGERGKVVQLIEIVNKPGELNRLIQTRIAELAAVSDRNYQYLGIAVQDAEHEQPIRYEWLTDKRVLKSDLYYMPYTLSFASRHVPEWLASVGPDAPITTRRFLD